VGKDSVHKEPFQGADLYVFRYVRRPDGWHLANSKPCRDCIKLIKKAKIRRVYYSVGENHSEWPVACEKVRDLKSGHVSSGRANRNG